MSFDAKINIPSIDRAVVVYHNRKKPSIDSLASHFEPAEIEEIDGNTTVLMYSYFLFKSFCYHFCCHLCSFSDVIVLLPLLLCQCYSLIYSECVTFFYHCFFYHQ